MNYFCNQIPKINNWDTIHAETVIKRNNFSFRRTMWNWSLFLAHPTYWHKRVTSENTQDLPDVDFESSRSPAKSESWNDPNRIAVLCFPQDNIVWIHMCDECTRSNVPSVCRELWSILWWHEQACSRTIKYQVYQYEPNTDMSEQFVRKTVDISPTDPVSSSLNWWSSRHGVALVSSFSLAPAEILDSNIPLYFVTMSLLIVHSLWVQPKFTWSRNEVGSSRSTSFMRIFQSWFYAFCFACQFDIVHMHW